MKKVLVGLVAVLLIGGGAFAAVRLASSTSETDPQELVPQGTFFYSHVTLDPDTDQEAALDALTERFPRFGSRQKVIDEVKDLIQKGLEEEDFSYQTDIDSWLGEEVAFFSLMPSLPSETPPQETGSGSPEFEAAGLIATKDADAAQDFIDKVDRKTDGGSEDQTYEGIEYRVDEGDGVVGLVEDFVVVGTEAGFKKVVDTVQNDDAKTLVDDRRFQEATADLRDDRLALVYLDLKPVLKEISKVSPVPFDLSTGPFSFGFKNPLTVIFYAQPNGAVVESVTRAPSEGALAEAARNGANDPGLLPELPGATWGAVGVPNFGDSLRATFEALPQAIPGFDPSALLRRFENESGINAEKDVLSWMGAVGFFVQGDTLAELDGGVVIESSDPKASTRLVIKLAKLVGQAGTKVGALARTLGPGVKGFSVQEPDQPQPVNFAAAEDRVVIAYGNEATASALGAGDRFEQSEIYLTARETLGEDLISSAIFDIQTIIELVESSAPVPENYEDEVKPFLDPLSVIVFGGKLDGDTVTSRIVVGAE